MRVTFTCTDGFSIGNIREFKEDGCLNWLIRHKCVYQKAVCEKYHTPRVCYVRGNVWKCPDNTCRATLPVNGPLLDAFGRRSAKDTLTMIYGLVFSVPLFLVDRETSLSLNTLTTFSQLFEAIIASMSTGYARRRAQGTARFIQKDETCVSKVKPGGLHHSKRVRGAGSTWIHAICITDVHKKALEYFLSYLPDRKKATMTPEVVGFAANARTLITTDGCPASKDIAKHCRHESVNHKKGWVIDGIQTNAVESKNSAFKAELKRRGNRLGNTEEGRENRAKFTAEQVNGKNKRLATDGCVLRRLFQDCSIYSKEVCIPSKETAEQRIMSRQQ